MMTSITDIGVYKRCRRRWNYSSSNRGNLTSRGLSAPALELGTLIHLALADWTNDPSTPADEHFAKHARRRIKEVQRVYREHRGSPLNDLEIAPLYESIELGMAMCANYQTKWKQPLGDNFVFAAPEQEVIVDIPGTPHQLRAILDGLIRDRNGTHLILERKTYSRRPTLDALEQNDQFMGYVWVCKQLGVEKLGGVAYDGLWKRKSPPRGNTLDDLFVRNIIKFYPQEIDDWGLQLAHVVNEMANSPAIYPNRRWEGCNDCGFVRLCQSESRGEDIDTLITLNFVQRENTKPILASRDSD